MQHRITPIFAILITLSACDMSGCVGATYQRPSLQSVMARVDVPRLLECASQGSAAGVAKCLGAQALTQGMRLAMDEAVKLAESAQLAADGGAGADDYTPAQREQLAYDLDHALDSLALEIEKANRL